jgi:hypothetical protein
MLDVTKKQANRRRVPSCGSLTRSDTFDKDNKVFSVESLKLNNQFVFTSEDLIFKNKLKEFNKIFCDFYHLSKSILEDSSNVKLCNSENPEYYIKRWRKLLENFYSPEKDKFDSSKLTNILDFIR